MSSCCSKAENAKIKKQDGNRKQELIDEIEKIVVFVEKLGVPTSPDSGVKLKYRTGPHLNKQCNEFFSQKQQQCDPPTITTIGIHETRPTSDYTKMQYQNSPQVTYQDNTTSGWKPMPPAPWDLPRNPSQELRGGNLYQNCDCLRRNGLQQDCPRSNCGGRPECVAVNPGPCCTASQSPKPVRGDRRYPPKRQQGPPSC